MIIVRSKFVSVVFARVDGESTLSAVLLVLPARSTQSPTLNPLCSVLSASCMFYTVPDTGSVSGLVGDGGNADVDEAEAGVATPTA